MANKTKKKKTNERYLYHDPCSGETSIENSYDSLLNNIRFSIDGLDESEIESYCNEVEIYKLGSRLKLTCKPAEFKVDGEILK